MFTFIGYIKVLRFFSTFSREVPGKSPGKLCDDFRIFLKNIIMNETSTRLVAWLQKGLAGQGKSLEEFSSCARQDKSTLLVSIIRSTTSRYGKKKLTKKSIQILFSNLKKYYALDIMYDENYLQAKNAFEEYIKSTQEKISNLKRPDESNSEGESKKPLKIRLSR